MGFAQNMAQCEGRESAFTTLSWEYFRDLPRLMHVHFLIVLRTLRSSIVPTPLKPGKDFQSSTSLIIGRIEKQLQLKQLWSTGRNR
ncbi:unnamed protein product [Rhizophagus irregularis]|nr:unnamed protein product [Rhizophagus irregularis]CAB5370535.1 unnamed protein product [Rhizophagus irregularis]